MQKYITAVLVSVILASALSAGQPQGGDFVITKSTIDGGGGTSTGGNFVLSGTIGQPDASEQPSTGGDYALAGGFWAGIGQMVMDLIFEDGFE